MEGSQRHVYWFAFPPRDQMRLGLGKTREKGRMKTQIWDCVSLGSHPLLSVWWCRGLDSACSLRLSQKRVQEGDCRDGGGWRAWPFLVGSCWLPVCLNKYHSSNTPSPWQQGKGCSFSYTYHYTASLCGPSPHPHSFFRGLRPSLWGPSCKQSSSILEFFRFLKL